MVIGSRYVPGAAIPNWTLTRLALSRGGNLYASIVLGLHVVFGLCVLASIALRGRVRIFALAHYYLLVTLATLLALGDVARGVPAVWERAEGTR